MSLTQQELGQRLRTARDMRGMTQGEVADQIGVSRSTVAQMELGNRAVSSLELGQLANLFGQDVETLLEKRSEEQGAVEALLRALPAVAQDADALEVVRRCIALGRERTRLERLLDIYREHVSAVIYQLRPPKNRWEAIQQGEMVAEEERRRLGLGVAPVPDLLGLLEWQDVRTAVVALPDDTSGLTLHEKNVGFFVVLNGNHGPLRRRFSLAHEHAHILIDRQQLGVVSQHSRGGELVELRANVFAASLLMPSEGVAHFIESLGKGRTSRSHAEVYDESDQTMRVLARAAPSSQTVQLIEVVLLAHHFGVSHRAALYRLYNVKLLAEPDMRHIEAQIAAGHDEMLAEALSLSQIDQGLSEQAFRRRFLRLVLEALRREVITWEKYFQLVQLIGMSQGVAALLLEHADLEE